jgi:acetylornithine deacetylase/succinyl-diaminopimelate desuccinylase-like protein
MSAAKFFEDYDRRQTQLLHEFFEFLRIPSISSEPEYRRDVLRCADWVENFLRDSGLAVERWEGEGYPVIFAERLLSPDYPTIMIYQHYDVQPVDPVSEWLSPPFEPTVRDGQVYCRGAQDNKGHCYASLAAVRALLQLQPDLPVNIKLLVEGEEESGSELLTRLLTQKQDKLRADAIAVPDVGVTSLKTPSITLGTRGMVSLTVHLHGSNTDLHSGMVGGIVYNPNRAIAEMLASLYNADGSVAVPGFYDSVENLSDEEVNRLSLEFDEERFKRVFEAEPTGGELAYPPLSRAWIRPTLEINGVGGGYTGSGFKTVIPAHAVAKISARLVPNQNPEAVALGIKNFLLSKTPPGIRAEIEIHPGHGEPLRTSANSSIAKIASQAISESCGGIPCGAILCGGSIPVISKLAKASGAETVFMGYGLDTDQIHAPNEHFGLDRLRLSFATIGRMIELFGK